MKNLIIIINILSLFLVSCGHVPPRAERSVAAETNCALLMKVFITPTGQQADMSKTLKDYLGIDLSAEEVSDYFKYFSEFNPTEREASSFRAIFYFSNGDAETRRALLSAYRTEVAGGEVDSKNQIWKKFTDHRKKVEKKTSGMISEKARVFEKLYYSCKSQVKSKPTPETARQAKRLTYALTAGGLGSSIMTYSAVNWEEEKNSKWFNELYFSLGISLVFTFISAKFVLANDKLHPWKGKMPLTFLNAALADIGVSGAYHYFFNTSDKELEKKLEELKKDPKAQEKLQEILKVAEEEGLFEKYATEVQKQLKLKNGHELVDREKLTIDDIDFEASRDLLIDALAEKEYRDKSGVLATGSVAVDRFTFHRIYNILAVPANIGLSLVMYNQMCMAENPKKGFAKAVATNIAVSILLDAVYYQGRKDLINQ